jgi:superfamily II helicase
MPDETPEEKLARVIRFLREDIHPFLVRLVDDFQDCKCEGHCECCETLPQACILRREIDRRFL